MNANLGFSIDKAAAPQNPIPGAISALSASISGLEIVVSGLRDRLSGVLTPPAPPAATNNSSPGQLAAAPLPVSDITSTIAGQSRHIDMLAMQLNDMLMRLET